MTANTNISNKHMKHMVIGWSVMLVLVIFHFFMFSVIYSHQKKVVALGEVRYQSDLLADELRQSSDDLTRMVRTYAATGNKKFKHQFREVLAIRDGTAPRPKHYNRVYWDFMATENGLPPYPPGDPASLKKLMIDAGFSDREMSLLEEAIRNSDKLTNLEQKAIDALEGTTRPASGEASNSTSNQQTAIDILFGEEYHQTKVSIMAPINTFMEELDARTYKEVSHHASYLRMFLWIQKITFVAIIITLITLLVIAKKNHADIIAEERKTAEKKIKILSGLLPICAKCKKVRDDKGEWSQIEQYISIHSEADFTHFYCPECYENLAKEIEA